MRSFRMLLIVTTVGWLGGAALAQQQAPPRKPAAAARPPTAATYQPAATVQDLMADMIDPSSKVVFTAVSSEATATGTVEIAPKNDAEWAVVRRNALMLVEGANLLMMPGRHITRDSVSGRGSATKGAAEGELAPAKIEGLVAGNRAAWNRFAAGLRTAALLSLKAAEGRKADDFGPASEAIDMACENCHLRFWYPDQEKLVPQTAK
jgi:hypothetical protein